MAEMHDREDPARPAADRSSSPWLEWVAAGLGLATLIGLFGGIGWQAVSGSGAAPLIVVAAGEISAVGGGYRVEVLARNESGSAAAQVEIEGRLAVGRDVETGRVTFDYIPGRSKRTGWLAFGADPRSGALTVRVVGYVKP